MASTASLCKARTRKGQPCQVRSLDGSDYCWFHCPDKAEERKQARSAGGRARHGRTVATTSDGDVVQLGTVADVVDLLQQTVRDVLQLENSVSRARCVGYLAGIAVKALEVSSLEERIQRLEELQGVK